MIVRTLIALTILTVSESWGQDIYRSNPNKRIEIKLSDQGMNRLRVENDRIEIVRGYQGFTLEGNKKTGEIYISADIGIGEKSSAVIETDQGYIQDVKFVVIQDNTPRTILIKKPVLQEEAEQASQDTKRSVIRLMKKILSGNERGLNKKEIREKDLKEYNPAGVNIHSCYHKLVDMGVKVTRAKSYSNSRFKIWVYEYKEKPSELMLKERFQDVLAVAERGDKIIIVDRK